MTARLDRLARRLWSSELGWKGRLLSIALAPPSVLWGVVAWLRNARFDRGGVRAVEGLAVVSVGNLSVGGTGKTPFTSWVARTLSGYGARPAILLRGYGHDEVLLHRRWTPSVPVVARRDRVEAARHARAGGADVAVLDDGFQHRRLGRVLDIVLLAVEDPPDARLLPRGPYREPLQALRRANVVVMTRRTASIREARAFEVALRRSVDLPDGLVTAGVHLAPHGIEMLANGEAMAPQTPLREVLALTAVARPDAFRQHVADLSEGTVELLDFPDHHDFTADELRDARARARGRPIVVTEKDAVKLRAFSELLGDVRVLTQRLEWDWGEEELRRLLRAVPSRDPGPGTDTPKVAAEEDS